MPQEIPLDADPDAAFFTVQAPLDGTTYTLQLRWNVRAGGWWLDVLDADGQTVLMAGRRVVANFPLGRNFAGRTPRGALVALDTSGQGLDPGLGDLGGRVRLLYYSAAELGLA